MLSGCQLVMCSFAVCRVKTGRIRRFSCTFSGRSLFSYEDGVWKSRWLNVDSEPSRESVIQSTTKLHSQRNDMSLSNRLTASSRKVRFVNVMKTRNPVFNHWHKRSDDFHCRMTVSWLVNAWMGFWWVFRLWERKHLSVISSPIESHTHKTKNCR